MSETDPATPESSATTEVSTTVDIPEEIRTAADAAGIEAKHLRPTWADTMAEVGKSKAELNKLLGQQAEELGRLRPKTEPDKGMVIPDEPTPKEDEPSQPKGALATLKSAGLDPEAIQTRWREHGALADTEYEAIQKANPSLDRETVDALASGLVAQHELAERHAAESRQTAIKIVAGKYGVDHDTAGNTLKQLLAEAPEYVPADELDDLKRRVQDPKAFRGAIRDLMDFHAQSVGAGKSNPLVTGQPAQVGARPKTKAEYFAKTKEIERKAQAGTATLADMRALQGINPNDLPENA